MTPLATWTEGRFRRIRARGGVPVARLVNARVSTFANGLCRSRAVFLEARGGRASPGGAARLPKAPPVFEVSVALVSVELIKAAPPAK